VKGTQGLRVVDASIFPKIPGFFILSAIYMIAEKAGDAIIADAREIDRKRRMIAERNNDIN
jgi:choline dehydrogenase-like flavoprotein